MSENPLKVISQEQRQAQAEAKARLGYRLLDAIDHVANLGLWYAFYDDEGEMCAVEYSDVLRRMLNVTREDFRDTTTDFQRTVHPDDLGPMLDCFYAAQIDPTNQTRYDCEYRMMVKGEGYRWFHAVGDVVRKPDGSPEVFIGSFERIHEKKIMEADLAFAQHRQNAIDKMMLEGTWSLDLSKGSHTDPNTPMQFSDQFKHLLGYYSSVDFPDIMETWLTKIHPDDVEGAQALIERQLADTNSTPFDMEYRIRHRNGEYRVFRAFSTVVRAKDRTPLLLAGTIMDITEQEQLANTDFLTSLNNRRAVQKYLWEMPSWDDVALVMTDLDNFKAINDTLGHDAGDHALITTAHILCNCFAGDFVSRLGGDEFLIAANRRRQDTILRRTQRFIDKIAETAQSLPELRGVTASAGIVFISSLPAEDRDDLNKLLKAVDTQLYEAKRAGKNCYAVYSR